MSSPAQEWIVVLECTRMGVGTGSDDLSSVMAVLAPMNPAVLPGPDRYALQVRVITETAPEAVRVAATRWEGALAHLGVSRGALVRAEVLTFEEFEWECDAGLATVPRATGMVTTELLRHHLEYSITSAGDDRTVALLLVEVDPDADLDGAGRRLGRLLRSGDLIAPMSGSVFAVLLDDTSERVAAAVTRRLGEAVAATVGFALGEPGRDGDALIAAAHDALRRARGDERPGHQGRPEAE